MNCEICKNYNKEEKSCEYCKFDVDEDKLFVQDDWDILNINNDIEWGHIQILRRLHGNNIDCIYADIWMDNNIAYLIGCTEASYKIAGALGIHEEVIYNCLDSALIIINLYQEKDIRREKEKQDIVNAIKDMYAKKMDTYNNAVKSGSNTGIVLGELELLENISEKFNFDIDDYD